LLHQQEKKETMKTLEKMKQLEADFWPRFAKEQSHLIRIIQTRCVLPEDAPLVTTMALYMLGELAKWETQQIEQLPIPHENVVI
jgi:hypothetical protein